MMISFGFEFILFSAKNQGFCQFAVKFQCLVSV